LFVRKKERKKKKKSRAINHYVNNNEVVDIEGLLIERISYRKKKKIPDEDKM